MRRLWGHPREVADYFTVVPHLLNWVFPSYGVSYLIELVGSMSRTPQLASTFWCWRLVTVTRSTSTPLFARWEVINFLLCSQIIFNDL
jgi:hypothetical protein